MEGHRSVNLLCKKSFFSESFTRASPRNWQSLQDSQFFPRNPKQRSGRICVLIFSCFIPIHTLLQDFCCILMNNYEVKESMIHPGSGSQRLQCKINVEYQIYPFLFYHPISSLYNINGRWGGDDRIALPVKRSMSECFCLPPLFGYS